MTPRSRSCPSAVLGVALVSACASTSAAEAFEDVRALVSERGVERVHWNVGSEADAAAAEAVRELLREELTVDAAAQIALLNNRNLQAVFEELGIAQADLVQAGLLSNPIFHGEVRFPDDPDIPLELDITQDFLSVFLLPLRKRVAKAELEAAKLRVANAVLELAARTRAAFYTLQGTEQMLEMRRNVVDATESSAEAARRLHEAGNMTDLELANEQALYSQARLELAMAEKGALDAREDLTMLMGLWGEYAAFSLAARLPEVPESEIPPGGLESLAVSQRLDLAAARAEVELFARVLGLRRFAALEPEVGVTGHLEREPDGVTTTGPSLEIPIPLFDQGQAARARAWAMLRQTEARYAALAVEIRSEVRRARNRMLSARSRAQYYVSVLLPLRAAIVEHTQLEYNAMLTGVFQLLQAKQAEIDAGRGYIEALQDYWIARTELEHAVGGRLPPDGSEMHPGTQVEETPAEPAGGESEEMNAHDQRGNHP